ncbi:MAG: DUF1822 family protein [Coleofasciculaceae cyanobacterium SM2_1_6]|nr:DUF1822 family protein [Coleofasciculaceae cyanobacterium SM2_1_6]
MKDYITLQEINDLRIFCNSILRHDDIEDVIRDTFTKIEERISPQIISVFLFSKEGRIEKYRSRGIDKDRQTINETWLPKENYKPGESFSGRAAQGNPYGETYSSNSLDTDISDFTYGQEYADKLGFLKCGISVPLNATHRTFGTIEVVNRINNSTDRADPSLEFDESDVCWLTIVGSHAAVAISRLRKKDEDKVFATISRVLANPELEEHSVHSSGHSIYQEIAENLVGQLMPYKVCIVRLTFDGKSLIVTDKAHSDGKIGWNGRSDEPRYLGQGLVGTVFKSGEFIEISNISERKNEFTNRDWIESQGLESFICFPLIILGKVIGTLSLFTGYVHEFTKGDREFLENVSFLLAAYKVRAEKVKKEDIQDTNLTIPLNNKDHEISRNFSVEQGTPEKRKQVYLNTLAVLAVHRFLESIGIETDLETSDSWNPAVRCFHNVADLVIPEIGRIECRPVLPTEMPGETFISLPPEITEERIAYIAVQFQDKLNEVQLLGFYMPIEPQTKAIDTNHLEPIETLVDLIDRLESVNSFLQSDDQVASKIREKFADYSIEDIAMEVERVDRIYDSKSTQEELQVNYIKIARFLSYHRSSLDAN